MILVFMVLLLWAVSIVALGWAGPPARSGPVYSVDQFLTRGYAFHMRRGQVALVRGQATCGVYPNICWINGRAAASSGGIGLMVYRGYDNRLLAALRRVPFVGPLLPYTAAYPLIGRDAVYRVEFVGCPMAPACDTGMTEWRLIDGGSP